jgi:hypothetical protein
MTTPRKYDDAANGELEAIDPIRVAFAQAIGAIMNALPEGNARRVALEEIMSAHERTSAVLATYRRTLN